MAAFVRFVDKLSMWTGHAFAWCIMILTFAIAYEVFVRYVLRAPTGWSYDVGYMMYGALFLMAGAYTLSRNGHVRGDVLYRLWRPRTQAAVDAVLYLIFFMPAAGALIYSGFFYAAQSWRFKEVSVFSPAGVPVYPMKALIPVAGIFLLLQGLAELGRCWLCIRNGRWPARLHDVEELDTAILHQQESGPGGGSAGGVVR